MNTSTKSVPIMLVNPNPMKVQPPYHKSRVGVTTPTNSEKALLTRIPIATPLSFMISDMYKKMIGPDANS